MSDTPKNAKNIALHGTGILLSTIAGMAIGQGLQIGQWLQSNPKTAMSIAGAVGTILYAWGLLTWHLLKKTSDLRLRERFEHDTASDMSIERAGRDKGRKVCTRCLHKTPALVYPLHDPHQTGRHQCSGCGAVYEDAAFKAAQKLHFAEQEREQAHRNNQYS
jgi:hypothetical protein